MRTSKRYPVLLIPGEGETRQHALNKLLAHWKQTDRKRQNNCSRTTASADHYLIKVLTRANYQRELNNGKYSGWKSALNKYYGTAYIPRDILPELKVFFKTIFALRLQIKPIIFYDKNNFEELWYSPDLQTLVRMAHNYRR